MKLCEQNVLFFTRTMKLGGTENVVLQLCEIFQPLVKNIVVCSCGGVNTEKLEQMNIKHYQIPDIECKKPQILIQVSKQINKIVKKENITIIHTHHRMAAFYVTFLRLYKSCFFVNTSHNTFTDKIILTNYAYKHASMIACGEMVKKNLIENFALPESQVSVIHNAIKSFDKNVVEEPIIQGLRKEGCYVIGNVGRLSEQKGMEYFIQAIPMILEQCPKARFLIVGSGEAEEKLKKLAFDIKVTEQLHFLGYRTDIQNLMSQMDLVVLSSLWEGFPLTPIEAFSVGKTVVATAVDGTIEIVESGVNGLLIEPKNVEQIAENVVYLINHSEKKKCMEEKASIHFETKLSFSCFTDKYIKFYEQIIDKN